MSSTPVPSGKILGPRSIWTLLAPGLVVVGIFFRLAVVVVAGNGINAPWSGTGDAPAYALLAQNLASGRGFAYAGHPTAYRAPVYPVVLAAFIKAFGAHALEMIRLVQFGLGILTVLVCGAAAREIFGAPAKNLALIVALFSPTLIVMTGEILTETLATTMTAVFLYLLVRFFKRPNWAVLAGLSTVVGVATLVRFNMALFEIVLLGAVLFCRAGLPELPSFAVAIFLPALIVGPWIARNYIVFKGALTLSTESGPTAAMGVLAPQGRALPGDSERLVQYLGWLPPVDLETNAASRNLLGSESDLNRQAWKVTFRLWREWGWRLVPLTLRKLSWFWLSTDQLLSTGSFRPIVRAARALGVAAYWVLLVLGIGGWFRLQESDTRLAYLLLLFLLLVTILHLPFNMNTRLRTPFVDPLLAILAGGALYSSLRKSLLPTASRELASS